MRCQNAKEDICLVLSWVSEAFSRPSFKILSSFVVGFIQLGKEAHTSSMVQYLSRSYLSRSLSSFTRFLAENTWTKEQLVEIALRRFFDRLRIKARCVVFLIIDDTIAQKSGKKIPGCCWHYVGYQPQSPSASPVVWTVVKLVRSHAIPFYPLPRTP